MCSVLDLDNPAGPDTQLADVELAIEVENVVDWLDQLLVAGITIGRNLEDAAWGIGRLVLTTRTVRGPSCIK